LVKIHGQKQKNQMKIINQLFIIFFTIIAIKVSDARTPISPSRLEQLSGTRNPRDSKSLWDKRYSKRTFIYGKAPAKFLSENYDFIPYGASVLDMGMGEGRHAVFLAQKGYKVTGIDLSSVAVKKASLLAKEFGVKIKTLVASLKKYKMPPESFDAVICFYWVDREMVEKIKTWLKPGGVLIYEGYNLGQRKKPAHKNEPKEYFLKKQELLTLFKGMEILKFEEAPHRKNAISSIIVKKAE
jgi:tellurite methyltransferase